MTASASPRLEGIGTNVDPTRHEVIEAKMWKLMPHLCAELHVRETAVIDKSVRAPNIVYARHVLWYVLSRRYPRFAVSKACGVHHSTFNHAIERVDQEVKILPGLEPLVERMLKVIDEVEPLTLAGQS